MEHRIRRTIRTYASDNLPLDWTNQQISQAPSALVPQLLMDMILCDTLAYSIKFVATRKKQDNAEKVKQQLELDDAVAILEADDGQDLDHTNALMDKVKTLSDAIQAQMDHDEQEAARRFLAKRKLEAETPTKNLCNQVKKSKQKTKLTCLLQERELTPQEFSKHPIQVQYEEIHSQAKIKAKAKDFSTKRYAK